eukprot:GHVS01007184.1.p1 GENE.GHVS01007184.1~~GHVS01007184.1.p1  ORF type:complete len:1054 (+),score=215.08 GHVS01007184.1:157-3318(+)
MSSLLEQVNLETRPQSPPPPYWPTPPVSSPLRSCSPPLSLPTSRPSLSPPSLVVPTSISQQNSPGLLSPPISPHSSTCTIWPSFSSSPAPAVPATTTPLTPSSLPTPLLASIASALPSIIHESSSTASPAPPLPTSSLPPASHPPFIATSPSPLPVTYPSSLTAVSDGASDGHRSKSTIDGIGVTGANGDGTVGDNGRGSGGLFGGVRNIDDSTVRSENCTTFGDEEISSTFPPAKTICCRDVAPNCANAVNAKSVEAHSCASGYSGVSDTGISSGCSKGDKDGILSCDSSHDMTTATTTNISTTTTDIEDAPNSDHVITNSNSMDPTTAAEQQDYKNTSNGSNQVDDKSRDCKISGGSAEISPQGECALTSAHNASSTKGCVTAIGDSYQERVEEKENEGKDEEDQEAKEANFLWGEEETEKGSEMSVIIMSRGSSDGGDEAQAEVRMAVSGNPGPAGEICKEGSSLTGSSISEAVEADDSSSSHLPSAAKSRKTCSSPFRLNRSPASPTRPLQMTHKRNILRQLGSTLDINSCPEWPPIKRNPVVHLHTWQVKSYSYTENGAMAISSMKTKKHSIARKAKTPKGSGNPSIQVATNARSVPALSPPSLLQTSPSALETFHPVAESAASGSEGGDKVTGRRADEGNQMVAADEEEAGGDGAGGAVETLEEDGPLVEQGGRREGGGEVENSPPWVPTGRSVYRGPAWLSQLATVFDGVETGRSTLGRTAGLGLFTTRGFARNSVVTEFVGWSIDRQDALSMRKKRKASHIVKSFGFREYICGISDVQPFIGGGSFANDGSGDLGGPGNNTRWYDFFDSGQGKHRKFLKATKDIQEGEEVFVCYHKNYWKDVGEEDGRGYLPANCTRNIKAVEGREERDDVAMEGAVGKGGGGRSGKRNTKDAANKNARKKKKSKTTNDRSRATGPSNVGGPSKKKRTRSVAKEEEKKGKKRRRREGEESEANRDSSAASKSDSRSVVVLIEKETPKMEMTEEQWGCCWMDNDGTGMEAVRFSWSDVQGTDEDEVKEDERVTAGEGRKVEREESGFFETVELAKT